MDEKTDKIIREIAAKNGIAVGRDDPIMIQQTINEIWLKDLLVCQQQMLDKYKEDMEMLAHRWGDNAKNMAERALNAALSAGKEAMDDRMREGAEKASEAMQIAFNGDQQTCAASSAVDNTKHSGSGDNYGFCCVCFLGCLWAMRIDTSERPIHVATPNHPIINKILPKHR